MRQTDKKVISFVRAVFPPNTHKCFPPIYHMYVFLHNPTNMFGTEHEIVSLSVNIKKNKIYMFAELSDDYFRYLELEKGQDPIFLQSYMYDYDLAGLISCYKKRNVLPIKGGHIVIFSTKHIVSPSDKLLFKAIKY